jgi:hypothetical protein
MKQSNVKFDGPRSVCACGHTGDGPDSQHEAGTLSLAEGHGACTVEGCDCDRFAWKAFRPEFQEALDASRNPENPDPSEEPRRALVDALSTEPTERERLEAQYGQVWNTEELQRDFTVTSFMAPFCAVTRKSDGVKGALAFQHSPRFYFDFTPE